MPYIEPNSDLILIKNVPFDPTYENTMYFPTNDPQAQVDYFLNHPNERPTRRFGNLSYIRKGRGYIRIECPISIVYQYGYMMYRNTEFENKWFFAFINKVEYVNNVTTDIYFQIDLLQTWHYEYGFNQCLIEREHVYSDRIGENLIEEDLGLGEYVWEDNTIGTLQFTPCIVVVCNLNMNDVSLIPPRFNPMPGVMYSGRIPGYSEYYAGCQFQIWSAQDASLVSNYLNSMANAGYAESIIAVFMAAVTFIEDVDANPPFVPHEGHWAHSIKTTQVVDGQSVNGYFIGKDYSPRNKKLMCSPYNFLYVLSSSGNGHVYRYEYFDNPDSFELNVWGNTSCNPGIILYPANYKGGDCFDESITITNFPLCCWNYDTFKAWLAQNIGSLGASVASDIASIVNGSDTVYKPIKYKGETTGLRGDIKSENAVNSGVGGLIQLAGRTFDEARRPPTQMGDGNGDLLYSAFGISYRSYHKHIRPEIAMKYDQYFDMYGYKVMRVGIPARVNRPCYTYVKTVDCSIEGNLPSEDKREIEAIYNKGVRWWRTNAVFGSFNPLDNNNLPFGGA